MVLSKIAIGLMSGTSMDGIDAAMIRTDGLKRIEVIDHLSIPYEKDFRARLKTALIDAETVSKRQERPGRLKQVEWEITERHSKAVKLILDKTGMKPSDIDIIGFHGQTILHRPNQGLTVQLGDGRKLAKDCAIDVIYDMRANDVKHGGQGAPLVPAYHHALALKLADQLSFPVVFVNIGGISNLTYVDQKQSLVAFDCGPGNVLIDQWMERCVQKAFDLGGRTAMQGQIDNDIVQRYLDMKKHQKSLDWRDFPPLEDSNVSLEDGAATLSYITAKMIFDSCAQLPSWPMTVILSGGGSHNAAIICNLQQLFSPSCGHVRLASQLGLNEDFMEAEAWAFLAVRSFLGLAITYPETTGCPQPLTGGVLCNH